MKGCKKGVLVGCRECSQYSYIVLCLEKLDIIYALNILFKI